MKPSMWHLVLLLVIGYIIGYWWRTPGNMTLGKIYGGM